MRTLADGAARRSAHGAAPDRPRHFARQAHRPQVWAVWWPRFERIAAWFCAVEQRRRREVARIHDRDARRAASSTRRGGAFRIRARADRIEIGPTDGSASSTTRPGRCPAAARSPAASSPQLTIEALIAEGGGFAAAAGGRGRACCCSCSSGAAIRWPGEERDPVGDGDLRRLLDDARRPALARLVAHFDDPATAYVPVPRPEIAPTYNDYDHLARDRRVVGARRRPA